MLDSVLVSLKPQLAALAQVWLAEGVTAFGIWEGAQLLAHWPREIRPASDRAVHPPEAQMLTAPIRMGGAVLGELRIVGPHSPAAQARLTAEAAMIARLAQLEDELEDMTSELIDTQDQILALYDLTRAVRSHLNLEDTLKELASAAARLVKTTGAFAILALPDRLPQVAQQPHTGMNSNALLAVFNDVQSSGQELLLNDLSNAGPADLGNLFIVPIPIRRQVVAALGLTGKHGGPFTSPDLKLARAIAEQAGAQIENALLHQELLTQARVQTEMELAQRVQLRLLPQSRPQVAGSELAARARPALQVGGDFYDFIASGDRPFAFTVGDVSGKGMGAALLMSMSHTAFRVAGGQTPQPTPADILGQVNEHLYDDLSEVGAFVTMFVGQYDHAARQLRFANAGHSPVLYCPRGGPARMVEADGPAVGVLPISLCENQSLPFGPGDLLIVATDGFSEAQNVAGEMFGYERLLHLTESLAPMPTARILGTLFAAIEGFSAGHPQDDDQTAVILKGTSP